MNWVGGSRNRLVMKNDAKKQREFFAKRKLQQKLNKLGIAPSVSSSGDLCSGSTDLLTLFVVNQIASKKTNQEPPKVAVFGRSKGSRHQRNDPLVLPMSPCSPSHLSLVEGPAWFSVQRKSPQKIKCGRLSPVVESSFSDNSASDYLPLIHDQPTSISPSSSSASSRGLFQLQMNVQKQSQTQSQPPPCYSPPWDTSALQRAEFQPFSQPRGMADPLSWSVRSNPSPFQTETPTASHVLFGSPKPDKAEARGHGCHSGLFCLNQLEANQSKLEFPTSQSEPVHLFEEEVFGMFKDNKDGEETAPFGNGRSKVYVKDESSVRTSSPQTVPNPQAVGVEFPSQLSNFTDRNSSCLGENAGPLKSFDHSPSCSCRAGYLSSDSNDDEYCCESCDQESAFYLDEACSDHLKSASQRISVQTRPRPLTPLMRSNINAGDNQDMMATGVRTEKASGSLQTANSTALSSSPRPLGETHDSQVCRCKKTFRGSRDTGTQTASSGPADTCDASTQCRLVADGETKASGFASYRPAVDVSHQLPDIERETDLQPQTLRAPSKGSNKEGAAHWIFNNVPSDNILEGPINPSLDAWSQRGELNEDKREQTGPDETNPLVKQESDEGREEVTSAGRSHTLPEEVETLREIADVLLLLRERKNHPK